MTEEEFINNQLQALSKSKFRTGFKLKEKRERIHKSKRTRYNRKACLRLYNTKISS